MDLIVGRRLAYSIKRFGESWLVHGACRDFRTRYSGVLLLVTTQDGNAYWPKPQAAKSEITNSHQNGRCHLDGYVDLSYIRSRGRST